MDSVDFRIDELESMSKYPEKLYYQGNLGLLERRKVSIIGSRNSSQYAQQMTHRVASGLSKVGIAVVSGGAVGIDAVAHRGAGNDSTIAVLPCGIERRYPAFNRSLLEGIEKEGLLLSQFDPDFNAAPWSFVIRNEVVVALGDVLIAAHAEPGSGSMRSIEYALKMGKKIYVFPHRIGESEGTNRLLAEGKAEAIYDIDAFVSRFGKSASPIDKNDPFVLFCASCPSYEDAVKKFPEQVFEAELNGKIEVKNGRIGLL